MIFYDEADGELRLGDGVTPGGLPVSIRADLITTQSLLPQADNVPDYDLGSPTRRWHHLYIGDGGIKFNGAEYPDPQTVPYLPQALTGSLVPATDNGVDLGTPNRRFANIYLGYDGLYLADQTTNNNINITVDSGTLFIDGAENLRLGNLAIRDTTLTSANNTLDISIGNTDDTGFFYVKRKAQFDNVTFGATQAMVSFNASGTIEPLTIFPDTVMQTTGRPNKNSRIVQRSYGSSGEVGGDNAYSVWASYSARGNVASPLAIKQNDILRRLSSNGFGTTTWGAGGTRIESVALENFTDSAKGSKINFWTTPVGSIVSQQVASITATGISANSIVFTTDGSVQTSNAIPFSQKGVATGVATLGIDGRLTTEQIPSSLSGAITFQGGWNANTNTPTLSNGTGVTGQQYIVIVGGDRNLGAGNVVYAPGDTITYGANVWNYVQGTSPISSVSGNLHMQVGPTTGAVVIGINATPNATASTVVSRDSSGNFQANTITALLAGQATSAITAATVTAGSQTAITAVGTLTSLAVTGNATAGNVTATTGTIIAAVGQFTNINNSIATLQTQVYANANVAAYLLTNTGNITAGNISDGVGSLRSIPQNSKNTGYTLQSTDNGQMINITTGNVTIPAGVFNSPFGQTVSIYNNQNSSNAVVQGSGVTLRLAGTAATGSRTLARYGVATVICVAANTFVISGAGLS
jgi:hypothetical protein